MINVEVFNYWEPAHFLVHGWGFQTWEYAPQFGIRSWTYILPHALVLKFCEFAGLSKVETKADKVAHAKPISTDVSISRFKGNFRLHFLLLRDPDRHCAEKVCF